MRKLCNYHDMIWGDEDFDEALKNFEPTERVGEEECEECIKWRAKQTEVNAKIREEDARNLAWFIQNLHHVPRSDEWKGKLINKLLPKN